MKKILKKKAWIALGLAATLSGTMLASACGGRQQTEVEIDKNKTQLYVQNFDGGIGTRWLYNVRDRFEEAYKDTPFEDGKKGVQLIITANKQAGEGLTISENTNEIFFSEGVGYYDIVLNDELLDISDIANEIFAQNGVSIDQKYRDGLAFADRNTDGVGEVYALPHYEVYGGVAYNKMIFDDYKLYIEGDENGDMIRDEDGMPSFTNASGTLFKGMDGIPNTYDDGLPATWSDFFLLCDEMLGKDVTPFILNGQYNYYLYYFCYAAWAAYGGYNDLQSVVSYDETVNYVTNIVENADSILGYDITSETRNVTNETGYLATGSKAKLVALAATEKLLKGDYFYKPGLLSTVSHLNAQEIYINSIYNNKPIAMLIDGSWWENEADSAFQTLGSKAPQYSRENSSYGWMALPNAIDENDTNGDTVTPADYNFIKAYAMVNRKTPKSKIPLAKTFLKFCYSLDELRNFTVQTGIARGLNYDLTEQNRKDMSSYANEIWNYRADRKVINPITNNRLTIESGISIDNTWQSSYGVPNPYMFDNANSLQWFNNMKKAESQWNELYGEFF